MITINKQDEFKMINMQKIIKNGIYVTEDLDNLPEGLNIFTLPITAAFNCNVNIDDIYYYFPLNHSDIITIKSEHGIRTIRPNKKLLNPEDNTIFMNQITIIMLIKIVGWPR